ncbi:hypothetical protein KOSB73_270296 [Klebsiella grimontii]|uniref:Uncharacterized protein n=1 Tax=Klebsiella grimontii TaxID=2058152 RepID=A0A285B6B2_9ENTR|nr:hypothetical protein KOSB73_270296 [Klebsiella grimontii]
MTARKSGAIMCSNGKIIPIYTLKLNLRKRLLWQCNEHTTVRIGIESILSVFFSQQTSTFLSAPERHYQLSAY